MAAAASSINEYLCITIPPKSNAGIELAIDYSDLLVKIEPSRAKQSK
jgi:hypothetical protein